MRLSAKKFEKIFSFNIIQDKVYILSVRPEYVPKKLIIPGKYRGKTVVISNGNSLFESCFNLKELDLTHIQFENSMDFSFCFNACFNLEVVKFPKGVTVNSPNLTCMFIGCIKLKRIDWNDCIFTGVERVDYMFALCAELDTIDLSNINSIYNGLKSFDRAFFKCYNMKICRIPYLIFNMKNDDKTSYSTLDKAELNQTIEGDKEAILKSLFY